MGKAGVLAKERSLGKELLISPEPPLFSEHPTTSALSVSLLSAWIVAKLRRRNFKKLQGQGRQSIMSEKLVEGVEGRCGAGQGGAGEDRTQGYSPTSTSAAEGNDLPFSGLEAGQDRWAEPQGH